MFLSALALLLVLVMAAQVWLGILLLFDGDRGSLARFKTEAEAGAPRQMNNPPATQPSVSPPAATQPMALGQ